MGLKEWFKRKKQVSKEPEKTEDTPKPEETNVEVKDLTKDGEVKDTKEVQTTKELLDILMKLDTTKGRMSEMIRKQYQISLEYPAEVYVGIQRALEDIAREHAKSKHKIDFPSFSFGIAYCLREVVAQILDEKKEKEVSTRYIS